jgi:hypothetical protein
MVFFLKPIDDSFLFIHRQQQQQQKTTKSFTKHYKVLLMIVTGEAVLITPIVGVR